MGVGRGLADEPNREPNIQYTMTVDVKQKNKKREVSGVFYLQITFVCVYF